MERARKHHRSRRTRRGTATVEFAVCLPAICLLVMASIESCSMIFLNQTLCVSGYEGVRVGIRQDATSDDVVERCREILDARQVASASVQVSPSEVAEAASGQQITVTISAPCDANSLMPAWFFGGRTVSTEATMVKE